MNIKQQIREHIIEEMLLGVKTKLSENVSFQSSGIMDSMGLLSLIHFVENRFGIEIVDNELVPLPEDGKFVDSRVLPMGVSNRDNYGPRVVPEKSLFVMGDNRDISLDSRGWGFASRDKVLGMAIIILYSWDHDPTKPFWGRIRWNRFGHIPN